MAKVNFYKKIDLKGKKRDELLKLLRDMRDELRNARANRMSLPNAIRDLRRNIARVLTELKKIGNE